MSVRSYKLVLADDDRLDGFDIAIVLRTVLRRFDMDVVSIEPIDGRASYAEIQARELSLTPEDEDNLARLLGRPEGSSGRGVRRGWWNMACWNGLSFEQQRRLIEVGNLPIDYEPEGEFCDEGATVCIETQHDKAPGPAVLLHEVCDRIPSGGDVVSRFKVGDRVARNGKTYKITRVSPGGNRIVVVAGRGEGKTQRAFSVDDVTKARVA